MTQRQLPTGGPQNPAAARNKEPIRAVLERVLPARGLVLEIASGTGVHVCHFAQALAHLDWQPSEADATLRETITAAVAESGRGNIRPPLALDVRERPWPVERADALVAINLTHIAPWEATEALFEGAAAVLPTDAPLVLYGPFRRFGRHTAGSNEAFDRSLRTRDRRWGLRDVEAVAQAAAERAFTEPELVEMPANNLCLVFHRASRAA